MRAVGRRDGADFPRRAAAAPTSTGKRITLFWADERAVPPDDPDSNYGLAERMLLSPLGARAPRAIRMPADTPQLGQAALWYDDALATELHGGALDLAILGVGEDGHICSLFPGHKALMQDDLRAVAIEDAPKPPRAAAVVDAAISCCRRRRSG